MTTLATRVKKLLTGRFNKELFPPVPAPKSEAQALFNSVQKIKVGYEVLSRTRGEVGDSALLVKELDDVMQSLVIMLDQRYGLVENQDVSNADEVAALVEGFENLITAINSHINNEEIHGGGTVIDPEELPDLAHDCMDCIDDGAQVNNKSWSSLKLAEIVKTLRGYMFWAGEWDSQKDMYYKGSTVRIRSTWTMTAIVDTTDPAEPLQTGPRTSLMPALPSWTEEAYAGPVFSGLELFFTQEGWFGGLEVWTPDVGPDYNHYIVVLDVTQPATPVYHAVSYPTLVPDEWSSVALSNIFVVPGSRFYLYLATINISLFDNWTGAWTFLGSGNNKEPSPGEYAMSKNDVDLRIAVLDNDSIDRSADLLSLTAGHEIEFTQTSDPTKRDKYRCLTAPTLVNGSKGQYYEWVVAHIDEANAGVGSGQLADAVATVYDATSDTHYVELVDHWVGNQPDYAFVQGYLFEGGSPNPGNQSATNDNGYGVNIKFTPGRISPDWGVVSYAPSPAEE